MSRFRSWNILLGWLAFVIAAITYMLTIEPAASFWDCGEFISSSFKLEVGHPPGAPFFMILGRIFSLFGGSAENAGKMINIMSALASAFTILFLFWTITHLAKKIVIKNDDFSLSNTLVVMATGLIGALSYTFSDTFWFSAVEAEVYATSSFFTAIVFWAILKWENVADEKYSNRWLILIAYLMGLSIGVHLLNLLTIPAIVMVYYFRKYNTTRKGAFYALIISGIILGAFMYILIPGAIKLATLFELIFINGFGMPYNSGVVIYAIALICLIIWGVRYTQKHHKAVLNTAIMAITVILIGYSSFSIIVIRSLADPPMDQNNPDNVFNLMGYINRDQYGDRPLLYGQSYNAPLVDRQKGKAIYEKIGQKYQVVDNKPKHVYDSRFTGVFPRMYSSSQQHIKDYNTWVNIKGKRIRVASQTGESEIHVVPTLSDNLAFFFKYQMSHMYFRYFMWNFAGRQNDIQGHGGIIHGNWLSGIKFIDEARLGNQDFLPEDMKNNPARNTYYMLPLLLGVLGLLYHYKKHKKDFTIVMMLFILTGIAIVVYLNQYPHQPRERDYAYAASFYAFAIWMGLGVLSLYDILKRKINPIINISVVFLVTLVLVPGLMAIENWDDHDRSGRYTARDFAHNYLNSCNKNAILFTNGDNDTFPLWYAQEVEGVRTDIRVVNLSYLRASWYIEQMDRKAYESDRLPFSLTPEKYRRGSRDAIPLINRVDSRIDIDQVMQFVASDDPKTMIQSPFERGESVNYIPANKFKILVDSQKVIQNGIINPSLKKSILPEIEWNLGNKYIFKDVLMLMDILATNNWERPIYWAITVGADKYFNLHSYFKVDGLTYQLSPIKTENSRGVYGFVDTDLMYDNMINKYRWGGIENPDVYFDENSRRMYSNMRNSFSRLAEALINDNKLDSAKIILDKCIETIPGNKVKYSQSMLSVISSYYHLKEFESGLSISREFMKILEEDLIYYFSLDTKYIESVTDQIRISLYLLQQLGSIATHYKQEEHAAEVVLIFQDYVAKVQNI